MGGVNKANNLRSSKSIKYCGLLYKIPHQNKKFKKFFFLQLTVNCFEIESNLLKLNKTKMNL